jgi:hypothetical protein
LGHSYILQHEKSWRAKTDNSENDDSCDRELFDQFDFFDVYKVGFSLLAMIDKKLKSSLVKTPFAQSEKTWDFLGSNWLTIIENCRDEDLAWLKKRKNESKGGDVFQAYSKWADEVQVFIDALPYVSSFYSTLTKIKAENQLSDTFYLNYSVDEIDFNSILLSSFINFSLGHLTTDDHSPRLGVTVSDFKTFISQFFEVVETRSRLVNSDRLNELYRSFMKQFGLEINGFESYLHMVLAQELSDYDFNNLSDEELKYVGGPLILNSSTH